MPLVDVLVADCFLYFFRLAAWRTPELKTVSITKTFIIVRGFTAIVEQSRNWALFKWNRRRLPARLVQVHAARHAAYSFDAMNPFAVSRNSVEGQAEMKSSQYVWMRGGSSKPVTFLTAGKPTYQKLIAHL